MKLHDLVDSLSQARTAGSLEGEVVSLTFDSRKVEPGSVFFAIRGEKADGHAYIPAALEKGASAIVAEQDVPPGHLGTWIQVKDTRRALAEAADWHFGSPSRDLLLAGITGTNGKTTSAFIIQSLIAAAGGRCGLIGTVKYDLGGGRTLPAARTTPDSIELQRLLGEMRSGGCAGAAMEVSSHALDQHRVTGIEFDAAVFTNLTQDHLDYHGTLEAYFQAKAKFFEHLTRQKQKRQPTGIVNLDDAQGKRLVGMFRGQFPILTFGMGFGADFRISDIQTTMAGSSFSLEAKGRSFLVRIPFIGRFNVFNAVGALAAVNAMDFNLRETIGNLAKIPQVPGRMQCVGTQKSFRVFVDYAHTPDALENALRTLRSLNPRRIITVFGCGGDRDAGKRPLMGAAAAELSDALVLTSDNPRSEDPEKILDGIAAGISRGNPVRITDRDDAIAHAIGLAEEGDIVLIAGKGHETGQTFADRTVPFDDVRVAAKHLKNRKSAQP